MDDEFFDSFGKYGLDFWVSMQLLTAILFFAAGIVGDISYEVSAKYCYAAHESRLHQNDRCKRFTLCLVLTVRFRSLAPWGKLFQLFI